MIGQSPFQRRRVVVLGLGALVMLAVAVMAGWRSGSAVGATAPPTPATAWELPHPKVADTEQEADILRRLKPWGGQVAFNGSEAPTPVRAAAVAWRLVGTVDRATEWYALISVAGQADGHVEYRTIGDLMPDGGKLLKINADSVTVQGTDANSEGVVYRLFDKKQ
ncbi:MAG: hypothetical protein WAV02_06325 [Stellaceae bacterium]